MYNSNFSNDNNRYDRLTNNYFYRLRQSGFFIGSIIYFIISLNKATSIPALVLFRKNIGRSAFSWMGVIYLYLILNFASVNDDNISEQSKINQAVTYFYSIDDTIMSGISPLELPAQNGYLFTGFTIVVLFLAIYNLIQEHVLPLNQKPKLDHRGDSHLLKLLVRKPDNIDVDGITQRFIEPLVCIVLGICLKYVHHEVGVILISSGISLGISEFISFNQSAIKR